MPLAFGGMSRFLVILLLNCIADFGFCRSAYQLYNNKKRAKLKRIWPTLDPHLMTYLGDVHESLRRPEHGAADGQDDDHDGDADHHVEAQTLRQAPLTFGALQDHWMSPKVKHSKGSYF